MAKKETTNKEETVEQKIVEIRKDSQTTLSTIPDFKNIKSDAKAEEASKMASSIQARLKKIEELRVKYTKPLVEQQRNLNALFKEESKPYEQALAVLKSEMSAYFIYKDKKAREEEAKRLAKQEEKNKKLADQGKEIDIMPVQSVERTTSVKSDTGGSVIAVKVWKFEVIKEEDVPRNYLEVNTSAIDKAVKAGARDIAGVRIYEDTETRVRSR